MPKWGALVLPVLLLVACSTETTEEDAAFTLHLTADSYGLFLPVNNQFGLAGEYTEPFYSGYFVQLATINNTDHAEPIVLKLLSASGDPVTQPISRDELEWMEIVCEQNSSDSFPTVLEFDQAVGTYLPDPAACEHPDRWNWCPSEALINPADRQFVNINEVACMGRVLHQSMMTQSMSLITLWKGAQGVSVETTTEEIEGHWHDHFVFKSADRCEIRVWKTGSSQSENYGGEDSATTVARIEVLEDPGPVNHGGIHQPPWY